MVNLCEKQRHVIIIRIIRIIRIIIIRIIRIIRIIIIRIIRITLLRNSHKITQVFLSAKKKKLLTCFNKEVENIFLQCYL